MEYKSIKSQYKTRAQLGVLTDNLSLTTRSLREKRIAIQSARDAELDKVRAEAARDAVLSSLIYASRIQRNLIPSASIFQKAFADYSATWKPRDIVSGDIYWIKNFDEGTTLSVCDCTGHGTPGALLTVLVVSAFGMIVNEDNYKDTAGIMRLLDAQLTRALYESDDKDKNDISDIRDGCDLAVLHISKSGEVSFSSANFPIFICNGKEVMQIKGQKLFVGEGKLSNPDVEVKTTFIPPDPNNIFYISSDGMFDQRGGARGLPFGYSILKKIILENHHQPQVDIAANIWETFENYRGEQPRKDDFELVSFKPICSY